MNLKQLLVFFSSLCFAGVTWAQGLPSLSGMGSAPNQGMVNGSQLGGGGLLGASNALAVPGVGFGGAFGGAGQSWPGMLPGTIYQGQPSGMVQALTPEMAVNYGPIVLPRVPLQRTEFQGFVQESTGQQLPLFGYALFESPNYTPVQNVSVPSDYQVGPGDEVYLRVWGAVDLDLRLTVDRNGMVAIPRVGSFSLVGTRAADLETILKARISKIYNNFQLMASIGKLRSMQVYVVGQARRPGAYTVSSLSTLVSALFESGGPSATGSMRRVQVKRGGKVLQTLDLYKFLTQGDTSDDIRLINGDVIVIPPAGPRVAVIGAIDSPAIFELAEEQEPLGRILSYGSGALAVTKLSKVLVERIQADSEKAPRSVQELSLDSKGLQGLIKNGDIVTLLRLSTEFDNAVTLRGNVAEPLRYPYSQGMKVSDLIPNLQALIEPSYYRRKNALVQFERDPRLTQLSKDGKAVDKFTDNRSNKEAADKLAEAQALAQSKLTEKEREDAKQQKMLEQFAERSDPWRQDEDATGRKISEGQLFNQVRNLFNEINWEYALVERLDTQALKPVLIPFNLRDAVIDKKPEANIELRPGDVVTIFNVKDIPVSVVKRSQFVRIGGEVNRPGVYQIQPGETLNQLIRRAGGMTPNAYPYGTVLTRESTRLQQKINLEQAIRRFEADSISQASSAAQNVQDADKATVLAQTQLAQRQMLARLRSLEPTGRVSLEINPLKPVLPDLIMEDSDQVTIPFRSDFVSVYGAVLTESSFIQREGLTVRDYLDRAGLTRDADSGQALVIRADGSVEGSNNSSKTLWGLYAGVLSKSLYPGDSIFVPEKLDRRTGYVTFIQGAKDWSQLLYQFGLGAAAYKTLKN